MKILAVALTIVMLWPSQAAAQCAPPVKDALGRAKAAFVGTVEGTESAGGTTLVRVQSIWLGERLPELVEVQRGSPPPQPLETGETYLFVTDQVQGATAQQDECDLTAPYTPQIAALEPDSAIGPYSERTPMWIGILIALLVVGGWQASRARRRVQEFQP